MKKGEKFRWGFTIIEVSLVISIAGLIFLMVFVALPGLRASQRDEERRTDVLKVISEIKNYQSNNRGALPKEAADWDEFYADYLGNNFTDPNGTDYLLLHTSCVNEGATISTGGACSYSSDDGSIDLAGLQEAGFPNDYRMYIVLQATCEGEQAVKSSNPRKAAVLYRLESAGVYCANT